STSARWIAATTDTRSGPRPPIDARSAPYPPCPLRAPRRPCPGPGLRQPSIHPSNWRYERWHTPPPPPSRPRSPPRCPTGRAPRPPPRAPRARPAPPPRNRARGRRPLGGLAAPVRQNGLVEPVVLVPDQEPSDDGSPTYLLVAGHRPHAACVMARHDPVEA